MPFPKLTDDQIRHELTNMLDKSKGDILAKLQKVADEMQSNEQPADMIQQIEGKIGEAHEAYDQLFAYVNRIPSAE
jgi:hypothetical protein